MLERTIALVDLFVLCFPVLPVVDPNAIADKVNAVKKYIIDITKVAEVSE